MSCTPEDGPSNPETGDISIVDEIEAIEPVKSLASAPKAQLPEPKHQDLSDREPRPGNCIDTSRPRKERPEPDGSVVFSSIKIDGTLKREAVEKIAQRWQRQIQTFYQREQKKVPTLSGEITIKVTVDTDGRVPDARVLKTTIENASLIKKVVALTQRTRFPKVPYDTATVIFTLKLSNPSQPTPLKNTNP